MLQYAQQQTRSNVDQVDLHFDEMVSSVELVKACCLIVTIASRIGRVGGGIEAVLASDDVQIWVLVEGFHEFGHHG